MTNDVESFAARLAAAWEEGGPPHCNPVGNWLHQFLLAIPFPEPDTCADGLSRLGHDPWPVRWYDDGDRVLGFMEGCPGYAIPWREIDAFMARMDTCQDDESPQWSRQLPLAG